jgi:putative membrane protein
MMALIAIVATLLVALIHVYILVLEMFLWTKPRGRRIFRTTEEFAEASRVLAANQGLYNGFLAAGLFWGLSLGESGYSITLFFLGCVAVAGLYGALTVGRTTLLIQTLPAVTAIVLTFLSHSS